MMKKIMAICPIITLEEYGIEKNLKKFRFNKQKVDYLNEEIEKFQIKVDKKLEQLKKKKQTDDIKLSISNIENNWPTLKTLIEERANGLKKRVRKTEETSSRKRQKIEFNEFINDRSVTMDTDSHTIDIKWNSESVWKTVSTEVIGLILCFMDWDTRELNSMRAGVSRGFTKLIHSIPEIWQLDTIVYQFTSESSLIPLWFAKALIYDSHLDSSISTTSETSRKILSDQLVRYRECYTNPQYKQPIPSYINEWRMSWFKKKYIIRPRKLHKFTKPMQKLFIQWMGSSFAPKIFVVSLRCDTYRDYLDTALFPKSHNIRKQIALKLNEVIKNDNSKRVFIVNDCVYDFLNGVNMRVVEQSPNLLMMENLITLEGYIRHKAIDRNKNYGHVRMYLRN